MKKMNNMKKINLIVSLLIVGFLGKAQVKDISVTFAPVGEYSFWDNKAGLEDGFLVGGKVGFGFGEFVELRATYLQSLDLKTNFENFGLANYNHDLFSPQEVTITRWGGEFKANIGTSGLMPYLTLGSGIQTIEISNSDKFDQIYASLGLGLKLNISERVVFLVEGKNTMFNFNPAAHLLTSADKTAFGVADSDLSNHRLSNWAVQGALQFYLGGRNPGTMSELDKAYLNQFRGGLKGLQLIVEPGAAYIAFDDNSLFRDTWLVGGYAGFDFNKYIGVRGFYFKAVESMELSTDFDKLSMYGVEFQARLNASTGITPFISLGGGYLDPDNDYRGENGTLVKGNEFATAGLGLNIPLGKRVLLTGGAKAMLTSSENAEDIQLPGDLQTHMMYNAGLKFAIGRKAKSPDAIYQENLNQDVAYRMAENDKKLKRMKEKYQNDIDSLEVELKNATDEKDMDKAVVLIEEKEKTQKALNEVESIEKMHEQTSATKGQAVKKERLVEMQSKTANIQMSPAEFESLVVNILKATRQETGRETARTMGAVPADSTVLQQQIDALNKRLDVLEKLLIEINAQTRSGVQIVNPATGELDGGAVNNTELSQRLLAEIDDLNNKIEGISNRLDNTGTKAQTILLTPAATTNEGTAVTVLDSEGKTISNQTLAANNETFNYRNTAAMVGLNVGGATTTNLGIRLFYDIKNTDLQFMPEIYLGVGSITSFGFSGNVIYPFSINFDKVVPYVGFGLGLATIDRKFRGNYNVIVGAQLPFISKNLSIDYSMRNSFSHNQLAIMYKLPF
jgi:hypothetical protein